MFIIGFFIHKGNLSKSKKNQKFEEEIGVEILKTLNENFNTKWVKPSLYKNLKTKEKFQLGNILISPGSVVLFKANYIEDGHIDGDALQREWHIKGSKRDYIFPNATIELGEDMEKLAAILPPNTPIIGIMVFYKETTPLIVNLKPYMSYVTIDNLDYEMNKIIKNLPAILDSKDIENIVNLLIECKQ
ncbi:hypothetical protein [[Mycoplasma] phocae]|nr:hypothetical protein [[Mycoplasma] phocae]